MSTSINGHGGSTRQDTTRLRGDTVVEQNWPYDGPYRGGATKSTATAMAELVRYLNCATRHDRALPYVGTVCLVAEALHNATEGLDQTLRQLERHPQVYAAA